jgi:L-amino acid N-acyltransferase YncA
MSPEQFLVSELPKGVYKTLYNLNFRDHGYMREYLGTARKRKCKSTKVFIIFCEELIIGWSLTCPLQYKSNPKNVYEVHLYIRKKYRQMGFGKKLLTITCDYLESIGKQPAFFPHNQNTLLFFTENNIWDGVVLE